MTALLATSLLAVLCLTNTVHGKHGSKSNFDYFSGLYNGHFSNAKQVESKTGTHDLVEIKLEPVLVPQLQPGPMIYIEEAVNSSVYRMAVGRLTQNGDKNTIYVDLFLFTDSSNFKSNEFDVKNLTNYKRKDFVSYGPCPQTFTNDGKERFTGEWADCGQIGTHPRYEIEVFCHGITFLVTMGALETATTVPYSLKLEGDRFPLIGSDYEAKCHEEDE